MQSTPVLLLLVSLLATAARADPGTAALDRGRLDLAWDSHASRAYDEVLRYLSDLSLEAKNTPEVLRLRAHCLTELRRYGEAVEALGSAGAAVPDRVALLEEVFHEWVRDLSTREEYPAVRRVLAEARRVVPPTPALRALEEAARFREEAKLTLGPTRRTVRLKRGEELRIARLRDSRGLRGWIQAYPWGGEETPVPRSTLAQWMPSLAAELERRGQGLWARVPERALLAAVKEEAVRSGLAVKRARYGYVVARGSEAVFVDLGEWASRAASEGLGIRGAAAAAVAEAARELANRALLVAWVSAHRGDLEVRRETTLLRLRNARTARSYDLDLGAWAGAFEASSAEWQEFWSGLLCELDEAPGRFRCACDRPAVLREVLLPPGSSGFEGAPAILEKGEGYELALLAVCPSYERYVTGEVLKEWGVSVPEAARRAQADATAARWELTFRRGAEAGVPYVLFEGDGASSLALRPALLLGALEAVEGAEVRGRSVTVVAPTVSSLAVLEEGVRPAAVRRTVARILLDGARTGTLTERLSYAARVRLPPRGAGAFRVEAAE